MKVLIVHNRYREPGGEDQVVAAECRLLQQRGHDVLLYEKDNGLQHPESRLALVANAIWSQATAAELTQLLRSHRVDVAHFHNTFFRISPAAYYACRGAGVPVIQTLHNYRLICPSATLYRAGRPCEACVGRRVAWPGLRHACYHDSRADTAGVAAMLGVHGILGTWERCVAVYVALSEHARDTFISAGFRRDRLMVKPNFVDPDPAAGDGAGGYALFAGRLSVEKGVRTLLAAWERMHARVPLMIVGDGPLRAEVAEAARRLEGVDWLGRVPLGSVLDLVGRATILVVPSEWYEAFPRVLTESFAKGTPVIGARIGAIREIVDHGRTGRLFRPGDAEDLVGQVEWLLSHPAELAGMRKEARAEFEAKYTAEQNYRLLTEVYERARSMASDG